LKYIILIVIGLLSITTLAAWADVPEGYEGMAYREIKATDWFPLAVCNYWIYEGSAKIYGDGKVHEFNITQRIDVELQLNNGDWSLYILKGHPMDVLGIEDLESIAEQKLVDVPGSKNGYLTNQNRVYDVLGSQMEDFKKALVAEDSETDLNSLASDEVFDFPLIVGKSFNRAMDPERADHYYEWYVMDKAPSSKWMVEGKPGDEYHLGFYTGPDHTDVWFVPGIGITHYKYHHNGTVFDVDVNLKEYHLAVK
jgi:hypothetical protein